MASGLKTDESSASLGPMAAAKRFINLLFRAGPTTTSPTPDPETAARWAARLSRARPPEPPDPGLAPRREILAGLETAPRPAPTHIYARYVEGLRSELQAQGLPTRADGVRILVVGEPPRILAVGEPPRRTGGLGDHAVQIARTISGPVGLAQGAVIDVLLDESHDSLRERIHASRLSQLAPVAEALVLNELAIRGREVGAVVSRAPADGRTTLVNMSNGIDLFSVASMLAAGALSAPKGSAMYAELCAALGHAPRVGNDADMDLIAEHITPSLYKAKLAASPAVRAAVDQLDADVVAARTRGVLVLKSAGNNQQKAYALKDALAAMAFDAVPSMMVVGAIDLGKHPTDAQDDTIAEFSVVDPRLHAVGMKVPVGDTGDLAGTSLSTPFVASVLALMLKANPRLTPDQLEAILKETARPLEQTGTLKQVDVVRAIARAAATAAPRTR